MRCLGRPLVAIFTAYALLLAPLLGATAYAPGERFALCVSQDEDAPADLPNQGECCFLGACHGAAPALSPSTTVRLLLPARSRAFVTASAASVSHAEFSLAASPRGPPPRA
jgi:hypothetical protein